MIAGGDGEVHICDTCVARCNAVLDATPPGEADWSWRDTDVLRATLPVAGQIVEATRGLLQAQIDHLRAQGVRWEKIGRALGKSRQAAWERFS